MRVGTAFHERESASPAPSSGSRGLVIALAAATAFLAACAGDDFTGPSEDDVDFPPLDASDLAAFCIRGERAPTSIASGSIDTNDCPVAGSNNGYFEGWRVRVASSGQISFAVNSDFDSVLEIVRIADTGDVQGSATLIATDDGSSDSDPDLDASLTVTLAPNTEYFALVSGFDNLQSGPYALNVSR